MNPTKKDLSRIIELNDSILKLIPKGDSMHGMYSKMSERLKERLKLYDKFKNNPYKNPARQFKLNSDESLELGEYKNNEN